MEKETQEENYKDFITNDLFLKFKGRSREEVKSFLLYVNKLLEDTNYFKDSKDNKEEHLFNYSVGEYEGVLERYYIH